MVFQGGGYTPVTLQFNTIRHSKAEVSTQNTSWTELYGTDITDAEANANAIIVIAQGYTSDKVVFIPGEVRARAYLRVAINGVIVGSRFYSHHRNLTFEGTVIIPTPVIMPLIAGVDYVKGVGFHLSIDGICETQNPELLCDAIINHVVVFSDRGI